MAQGKLSVEEYANEFERLHHLCELGDTLDFTHFLKGLRPSILKNMEKDCKDMYEAFWEAIRVELLIKHSRLRKAKMQEEKSLQTTEVSVVEPLMENASGKSEEKEPESHHSDSVVQVVHVE